MKELLAQALNVCLYEDETGGLKPIAEIILVVSEPAYHVDASGSLQKTRPVEQLRFSASLGALRGMSKAIDEYIDIMKETATRHGEDGEIEEPAP